MFLLLVLALPLAAQAPSAPWRTIETEHFRVHYPHEYEPWAMRAAERLESIREAVSKEVGFTPSQTIDVLVTNPVAEANGVAWPLLDTPRMVFFAEPPGPEEAIGAYGHWIDMLAVHETAHLVHMLRPSRNPMRRLLERSLLPLNPITLGAPRWVLEGYATVIEGRLTGAGRPSSTLRALILRRWAESGRLPSYRQLNSDRRFLGMSMAYLMGSAYLEWLEQRAGPASLRSLWARMTARQRRSFDDAFAGVFGEPPERLYGRFLADLTASAVTIRRTGPAVEGELFQETPRDSGDPAVSPDGGAIACVVREREKPARLVVWSTGQPDEEEKKYRERLEKILARDPEDVAPVRTRPLPREELRELVMPEGGDIEGPRWMPGGKSILFAHRMPDAEGFLHFDLFLWDFERVRRVTHLADVRDADPLPGGGSAVAVRSRHGASQLVTVDLATGAVTPRGEASVDSVVTRPRVRPGGGDVVASVEHQGGSWSVWIDDPRAPTRRRIDLPGQPSAAEWNGEDELIVSLMSGGFAELVRVTLNGEATPVTRAAGGAFDPAPSPDGRIFFTSLDPDGYVLRVIRPEPVAARAIDDRMLVPAIPPAPAAPVVFATQQLQPGRPYGIGRQELSWLLSQNLAPSQKSIEAGLRLGDVVGRLDALLLGSVGSGGLPDGGALAVAWRGWPVEVGAHVWSAELPSVSEGTEETGAELSAAYTRRFPRARLTLEGGASTSDVVYGSGTLALRQTRYAWRLDESLRLDADDSHWRATAAAAFRAGALRVAARVQHDGGDPVALGGLASSILPRSVYVRRVLDPALPAAIAEGDDYDGWRIEADLPGFPLTAFYQRHEIGAASISIAGAVFERRLEENPILKFPGVDFTAGAAYVFDAPLERETQFWIGMRYRP